jgi:hypothetical protein
MSPVGWMPENTRAIRAETIPGSISDATEQLVTLAGVGIGFRHDPGTGLTVVVWQGPVTPAAWEQFLSAAIESAKFPGRVVLSDLRAASFENIEADDVSEMATYHLRVANPADKAAMLIPEGGFLLAETFQDALQRSLPTRIAMFGDDVPAAARWIGVAAASIEAGLDALREELSAADEVGA